MGTGTPTQAHYFRMLRAARRGDRQPLTLVRVARTYGFATIEVHSALHFGGECACADGGRCEYAENAADVERRLERRNAAW